MRTVSGYQTVKDEGVPVTKPYRCKRKDAWLGKGIYYWDSRIEWGHWWGEKQYTIKGLDYIIGESQIVLDEDCFDLVGDVNHQEDFKQTLKEFQEVHGKEFPGGIVTVGNVIEYLKKENLFDYKAIRSHHYEPDAIKVFFRIGADLVGQEFMFIGQKVQICLVEANDLALQTFKIVYP